MWMLSPWQPSLGYNPVCMWDSTMPKNWWPCRGTSLWVTDFVYTSSWVTDFQRNNRKKSRIIWCHLKKGKIEFFGYVFSMMKGVSLVTNKLTRLGQSPSDGKSDLTESKYLWKVQRIVLIVSWYWIGIQNDLDLLVTKQYQASSCHDTCPSTVLLIIWKKHPVDFIIHTCTLICSSIYIYNVTESKTKIAKIFPNKIKSALCIVLEKTVFLFNFVLEIWREFCVMDKERVLSMATHLFMLWTF